MDGRDRCPAHQCHSGNRSISVPDHRESFHDAGRRAHKGLQDVAGVFAVSVALGRSQGILRRIGTEHYQSTPRAVILVFFYRADVSDTRAPV